MKQIHAFSLLELSIVLVIIGLIAGGIVAGAAMIRAAELRAIITEVDQYKIATNTFRDKYLGLPGDLRNATAFWGEADADPATCQTTAATGTETCNGTGDGKVATVNPGTQHYERFRFWQQLANAELVSGTFTGVAGSNGTGDADPGINVPNSKINGAGINVLNLDTPGACWWVGNYDHVMQIGTDTATSTYGPIMKPEELWSIDKKLDDGKPATGIVIGSVSTCGAHPNCTTTAVASTSEYNLASDDVLCNGLFAKVF